MDKTERTSKIHGHLVRSFAQLSSTDEHLSESEYIKQDTRQWPQSCFRMVMRCFLITWLVATAWGASIAVMLSGKPYGLLMGAIVCPIMLLLSFLPIRIIKVSLHLLSLSAPSNISESPNDAQVNYLAKLANPDTDLLATFTNEGQDNSKEPNHAWPNFMPATSNQYDKADADEDEAKRRKCE